MRISKSGTDICCVEEWLQLAPPERPEHWADGRSAKEFARAWFPSRGQPSVPAELSALFSGSPIGPVSFLEGEPEALLSFDNIRRKRQAALAATAIGASGMVALTIKAKERQSFDRPVGTRLDAVVGKRSELPERIQRLSLGLFGTAVTPAVRRLCYQLLYGTAASLCFAEASNAEAAAFIVFEFRGNETPRAAIKANQDAIDAFGGLLTQGQATALAAGNVIGPVHVPGNLHFSCSLPLYPGKVVRHLSFPVSALRSAAPDQLA